MAKPRHDWRCALCGRFMSWDHDVIDVSVDDMHSLDPAEPEMAHRDCSNPTKIEYTETEDEEENA